MAALLGRDLPHDLPEAWRCELEAAGGAAPETLFEEDATAADPAFEARMLARVEAEIAELARHTDLLGG